MSFSSPDVSTLQSRTNKNPFLILWTSLNAETKLIIVNFFGSIGRYGSAIKILLQSLLFD